MIVSGLLLVHTDMILFVSIDGFVVNRQQIIFDRFSDDFFKTNQ